MTAKYLLACFHHGETILWNLKNYFNFLRLICGLKTLDKFAIVKSRSRPNRGQTFSQDYTVLLIDVCVCEGERGVNVIKFNKDIVTGSEKNSMLAFIIDSELGN